MFKMCIKHTYTLIICITMFILTACEGKKEYTTKTFFTSDAFFSVTLPKDKEYLAEQAFKKADEFSQSGYGYAADMTGIFLKENGINDFTVNFGGNIYSFGKNNSSLFSAGIPNPLDPNRIISAIKVKNSGVSTYPAGGKIGDGQYAALSVVTTSAEKAQFLAKEYYRMSVDDINTVCRENDTPVLIIKNDGNTDKLCGWEKIELK